MAKEKTKAEENYIFTENATFRGDILEPDKNEMSERRKERLAAGEGTKRKKTVKRKRRIVRALTRLLVLVTVCVVIGLLGKSVVNIISLQNEKHQREEELQSLKDEISKDQDILQQVNSDEYIEQQARSELKMIKEGEILYVVRDDGTKVQVDEDGNLIDEPKGSE